MAKVLPSCAFQFSGVGMAKREKKWQKNKLGIPNLNISIFVIVDKRSRRKIKYNVRGLLEEKLTGERGKLNYQEN